MGKYQSPDTGSNFSDEIQTKIWIANELAEANRLKRLELLEKYGKSDYMTGTALEDQA